MAEVGCSRTSWLKWGLLAWIIMFCVSWVQVQHITSRQIRFHFQSHLKSLPRKSIMQRSIWQAKDIHLTKYLQNTDMLPRKKLFFPRIDKFYQMPQPWINICVSQNLLFCFSSNCYREKIRRNSKYFNALGINAVLQQRWGSCQNLIRNIIFNAYWLFYLKMQTLFFHFWIKTKPIVIHSNRSETRQSGHQYLMVNCWRWADEQLNQLLSIMSSILSPGKCLSRYHLKKNNLESTQVLCFRALASQFAEIQEMRCRATLDCFGPQSKEIHQWVSLDLQ